MHILLHSVPLYWLMKPFAVFLVSYQVNLMWHLQNWMHVLFLCFTYMFSSIVYVSDFQDVLFFTSAFYELKVTCHMYNKFFRSVANTDCWGEETAYTTWHIMWKESAVPWLRRSVADRSRQRLGFESDWSTWHSLQKNGQWCRVVFKNFGFPLSVFFLRCCILVIYLSALDAI
jgi:hypothetical protein